MDQLERRNYEQRLTDDQVKQLVDLIESGKLAHLLEIEEKDSKMKWLMASVRNAAVWVIAIGTAATVGYNALADVIKSMAGGR